MIILEFLIISKIDEEIKMLNGKAGDLPYQVVYATSNAARSTAVNICTNSAYEDGWMSAPNSFYPQELILDFHRSVCATEIKIISHQYAIPKEVFFEIADDILPWKRATFNPISSTKFTDNKERQYKAREMRSATLPGIHFRFLKLKITGAFQNPQNTKNQVGIVSFTVNGTIDNTFDDEEILRLTDLKRQAVDTEDYLLAAKINSQLKAYKANKAAIDELNKQKDEAVKVQNYTLAERLKNEIARLSNQPFAEEPLPPPQNLPNYQPEIHYDQEPIPITRRSSARESQQSYISERSPQIQSFDQEPSQEPSMMTDNRPIHAMEGDQYSIAESTPPRRRSNQGRRQMRQQPPELQNSRAFDDENMSQEIQVEKLTEQAALESQELIEALGEEPLRYFYSRTVSSRVRGYEMVRDGIFNARRRQTQLFVRFMDIIQLESNPQCFSAALNVIKELTSNLDLTRDAKHVIERFIPKIVDRLSAMTATNKRVNTECQKFLIWAASDRIIGPAPVVEATVKMPRQGQNAPSLSMRLIVLDEIINKYGEFDIDMVSIGNFAANCLDNSQADVRNRSMKIFESLFNIERMDVIDALFKRDGKLNMPKPIMEMYNARRRR
ncbi:UvrB/uvrC motif family protein [Trichomonas vaginalis G3]|uniref:UvrB/uvrC motif family protein n=1 Tax=Trichomonas vaginalis (strain ATCC PRA-98 / G3) TaxID=412133 RepID=A2E1A7_TRIV3|nr:thienylcyclohexylpiperidine binding [Trichomonas vaginalis G3]EAY13608.1 UvrB/uvrC motif family protein [Trichomonas vaginalis G3]KAI5489988.1 thienylcyclohexylpiperidine binding [Trichomonas vaginalis G3]|eukprot:XP_001325831.1 UvrB/uvrC motif family protein [Trichomonas vaginalis G3]